MAKYSFSQVWVYKQCPMKYRFKYVDWYPTDFQTTADLLLWNSVHYALEQLYNAVNNFKVPTLEETLWFFDEYWNNKLKELSEKWEELVIKWKDSSDDYIRRGKIYIEDYYNKHHPFDNIKVIDTEAKLIFDLEEWLHFNWNVDRLDKIWEDTFVITDYKTNKRLPTEDRDSYKEQLTLYWIWVKQKYWKYFNKLKARLYFFHQDIEDEWELTDELLEEVRNKYVWLVKEIEYKKEKYKDWDKKAFETNENPLCWFCEFQSICPLFSHINCDDEFVWELWENTIKNFIDEYGKLSKQQLELKKQIETIKDLLIQYIEKKMSEWVDYKRLFWNEFKLSLVETPNYSQKDKDKFKQMVEEMWLIDEVLAVDRFKVNALFKNWKLNLEDFEWVVEEVISKSFRASKNK